LGYRFFRVLSAGAGQPLGACGVHGGTVETIQEVLSLSVLVAFSVAYLGEPIRWQPPAGFVLIIAGAALVFSA